LNLSDIFPKSRVKVEVDENTFVTVRENTTVDFLAARTYLAKIGRQDDAVMTEFYICALCMEDIEKDGQTVYTFPPVQKVEDLIARMELKQGMWETIFNKYVELNTLNKEQLKK
jgi:hypothetical protein